MNPKLEVSDQKIMYENVNPVENITRKKEKH